MGQEFDSAWLKFGWAFRHGQRLLRENESFVACGPQFEHGASFDPVASELVLSVVSVADPPAAMSLTLADITSVDARRILASTSEPSDVPHGYQFRPYYGRPPLDLVRSGRDGRCS